MLIAARDGMTDHPESRASVELVIAEIRVELRRVTLSFKGALARQMRLLSRELAA
jgi:hypothetical protein